MKTSFKRGSPIKKPLLKCFIFSLNIFFRFAPLHVSTLLRETPFFNVPMVFANTTFYARVRENTELSMWESRVSLIVGNISKNRSLDLDNLPWIKSDFDECDINLSRKSFNRTALKGKHRLVRPTDGCRVMCTETNQQPHALKGLGEDEFHCTNGINTEVIVWLVRLVTNNRSSGTRIGLLSFCC